MLKVLFVYLFHDVKKFLLFLGCFFEINFWVQPWCSYMAVKNQKLHEQFDAAASSTSRSDFSSGRSIFSGVSIFVDGYTIPSSQV